MDPASLALGVVPLAANIVQTSLFIRQTISTYKSASAEISTILHKMDMISGICDQIQRAGPTSTTCGRDGGLLKGALKMCQSSIANIEKEIERVQSRGKKGAVSSMSFTFRKHDIEKSQSGLNDALLMLNSCLLVNRW